MNFCTLFAFWYFQAAKQSTFLVKDVQQQRFNKFSKDVYYFAIKIKQECI